MKKIHRQRSIKDVKLKEVVSYDYRKCTSLFENASTVHRYNSFKCLLCGCGGIPIDFNLWRQMTIEHIIGRSQGGGRKDIEKSISQRFEELSREQQKKLSEKINRRNKVTACSFCNSTTSRFKHKTSMTDLILQTPGSPQEVFARISQELDHVLSIKQEEVKWKLMSVREGFDVEVLTTIGQPASQIEL